MVDTATQTDDILAFFESDAPLAVDLAAAHPDEAWVVRTAVTLGIGKRWPRDFRGLGDEIATAAFDTATAWVQRYEGTDSFLLDMKRKATNAMLSDGMAAAVLDNMRWAYERRERQIAEANAEIEREREIREHGNWMLEIAQAAEYERFTRRQAEAERKRAEWERQQAERPRFRAPSQELRLLRNRLYKDGDLGAWLVGEDAVAPVATGLNLAHVGLGIYTLVPEAGRHLTVRVSQPRLKADRDGRRFVSHLSGSDNESDYTPFATVDEDGAVAVWQRYADDERFMEGLRFLAAMDDETAKEGMYRYAMESGNCAVCGRTLTHPTSLETGIGPECRKHVRWAA